MTRKTIVIIIGVVLVIAVGVLCWFLFFNKITVPATTNTDAGLPFGQGWDNTPVGDSGTTNTSSNTSVGLDTQGKPVARLFQVSNEPVAGMVAFNKKSGETIVRFVDRATGHLYDVNPVTLEKIQITNNTFPKTVEALFKNNGSSVILRGLKDNSDLIENISLILTAPKSTSTESLYAVKATNLLGNIGDMAIGPTNLIAYVLKDSGSIAVLAFDGSKNTNLFSSGFTDWKISWPNSNQITLVTKSSSAVDGFAYNLNASTGSLTKILGPMNALTLIQSSDGKRIAYSYNSNNKTTFSFENLVDKSTNEILPTTFADKCVWSKKSVGVLYCGTPNENIDSNEPDGWYQGIVSFSDQIWRFNTITATSELLSDPKKDTDLKIDMENLSLSPNEDYLFFMNKNDLTLWALKLQ